MVKVENKILFFFVFCALAGDAQGARQNNKSSDVHECIQRKYNQSGQMQETRT